MLAQAEDLLSALRVERYRHLDTQWKVLTVQVGLAELAWGSRDSIVFDKHVRQLLQQLRLNLKRTYVNLLALPEDSEAITAVQRAAGSSCGYRINYYLLQLRVVGNPPQLEGANATAAAFNHVMRLAAADFDDGVEFVVRYQPVTASFPFAAATLDSLSCLHPRATIHQALGVGLLQNMMTGEAGCSGEHKWTGIGAILNGTASDRAQSTIANSTKHAARRLGGENMIVIC